MAEFTAHPVRKERLADDVYGQILARITSGEFGPGNKLPSEAELSFAFNVSRTIVRQALLRLRSDGLVQAQQGRGTFVSTQPSNRLMELADVKDLPRMLSAFEPRIALEQASARLAAQRRTRDDLERMAESVRQLRAALEEGDLAREPDIAFHNSVAEASKNAFFIDLLNDLRAPVSESMSIGLELARDRAPERRMRIVEEHSRILDAISAGDGDAAEAYMKYHLLQARAAVLNVQHLEGGP